MQRCARTQRPRDGLGRPPAAYPYTAGLVTRRPLGCLFEIVETLVLTLIIFFVIQTFVAQPYRVEQQSMERTLEPDQYVLVDKLTPRFDDYSRGDIVVFEPPEAWVQGGPRRRSSSGSSGSPGETIEIRDGAVFVNGTPARRAVHLRPSSRRRPTTSRPTGWSPRRALRDGRPSRGVGRLARVRPDRARARSSVAPGSATGRSRPWGSSRRPTYPEPPGNGDARPSPAVP